MMPLVSLYIHRQVRAATSSGTAQGIKMMARQSPRQGSSSFKTKASPKPAKSLRATAPKA